MSTPISRNNRLQGPALYAPPRERERTSSRDQAAIAETPARPETEQSAAGRPDNEQPESNQAGTAENADCRNEADNETDSLDWVDQAIRAVIELEHALGGPAASDPPAAGAQSPSIAPAEGESGDWRGPMSGAQRRDHDSRNVRQRRPSLEPEIVPAPPAEMRKRGRFRRFMRSSLAIVFAAIVAYGLTMISTSQQGALWLKGAGDRVAGMTSRSKETEAVSQPLSRLVVEDQQAFTNEPVSLAVNVEHATGNESLLLDGLAQGTTLSAGAPTSPFSWRLPSGELGGLYLHPPKNFVGVMNTTVNLLGSDKRLLDSRAMELKWIAKAPERAVAPANGQSLTGAGIDAAPSSVPTIRPIDPALAAILMQRGRDFLSAGDISAARVALRRLTDAGIPDAAFALANTYDPEYLAAHNFLGMRGDRAMARALYQRAKELGSAEAGRILARMTAN